jgi:hypothetical protein
VNKLPRSPEFVSLYIDELLRNKKQDISDADVEACMDKVMPLFRYGDVCCWGVVGWGGRGVS